MFNLMMFIFVLVFHTEEHLCKATWYDTTKHKKVYRNHSTAAISKDLISTLNLKVGINYSNTITKGSFLKVTNLINNKIDTVEITDVSKGINHIDLCLNSFEKISNKNVGILKVKIKKV
jgi:hypothetical protein